MAWCLIIHRDSFAFLLEYGGTVFVRDIDWLNLHITVLVLCMYVYEVLLLTRQIRLFLCHLPSRL